MRHTTTLTYYSNDTATTEIYTLSLHDALPISGDPFGASPNALAFDKSGKTLFVCNGTQNAVGLVAFAPTHSRMTGLVPRSEEHTSELQSHVNSFCRFLFEKKK